MRIQLYNPPVHHYGGGVWYRINPPLSLPILAAVLQQAGHEVRVWDLEALRISPDVLGATFAKQSDAWPDAIGFTATMHNTRGARECVETLRGAGYQGYIVVGGPQATVDGRKGRNPYGGDAVVVGECEGNVAEIFETRAQGIIEGRMAPVADIPGPLWSVHHPQPTQYLGNMPDVGKPEGIAMWSRGCPHKCLMCANPVYGQRPVRRRSPVAIREDMAALKDLGVTSVFVYDDELPGMPGGDRWLVEVCEVIGDLSLTWKCQGRCTRRMSRAVLQAMYDAGCRAVMWGVESFSDPVLKAMHKGIREADIWPTLRAARDAGIGNWVFLMVANYQETPRDLAYTEARLALAQKSGLVQWRQVTVCTAVEGTRLHQLAAKEGWLVESPECGPQMAQVYAPTPWLTEWDIRHWHNRLMRAGL